MHWKEQKLKNGETFITSEKGNSMKPIIHSGQDHELTPVNSLDEVQVGDAVFCKVKGNYYTHLVKAKGQQGVLIGNNRGHINGWTKQVFGKVTRVLMLFIIFSMSACKTTYTLNFTLSAVSPGPGNKCTYWFKDGSNRMIVHDTIDAYDFSDTLQFHK